MALFCIFVELMCFNHLNRVRQKNWVAYRSIEQGKENKSSDFLLVTLKVRLLLLQQVILGLLLID